MIYKELRIEFWDEKSVALMGAIYRSGRKKLKIQWPKAVTEKFIARFGHWIFQCPFGHWKIRSFFQKRDRFGHLKPRAVRLLSQRLGHSAYAQAHIFTSPSHPRSPFLRANEPLGPIVISIYNHLLK